MTYQVIGIGNAIVDILCKVDDKFLNDHGLTKGSMSLIDETMALKLSELSFEKITSGGSAGNTIATLGQIDVKTAFIGAVGDDAFGEKFISEIEKTGCKFIGKKLAQKATARSFILVTPDAQRTMCTFLGCASQITQKDIPQNAFKGSSILYLEGYLWDGNHTSAALKKAISYAKQNAVEVAFTLSDAFCVARHKTDFKNLILNDLDILFANEVEILSLLSWPNFSIDKIKNFFFKNNHLISAITRSERGCAIVNNHNFYEIQASGVANLVDTTGAGDAFAAGFLCGLANHYDLEKSARLGNFLASKIIQQFGARFDDKLNLNSWHGE